MGVGRLEKAGRWAVCLLMLAMGLITLVACGNAANDSGKIGVVVSILPQAEFVERVGGDKVDVTVMVPPGADPHTYAASVSQMKALSEAKMYAKLGSGIEFELAWMDRLVAANRNMLVVDCSSRIDLIEMASGPDSGGSHDHGAMDPHIWTSPLNAQTMVRNICDGLVQIDPDNAALYERNRDTYLQELTLLDRDIRNALSGMTNRRFMVYHPALGYFAKEYDLVMLAVEEEGKEPSGEDITYLIQQAKENGIGVIFASPQLSPKSAQVVADAIGGKVVFIDPLARRYVANLLGMLGELVQAME